MKKDIALLIVIILAAAAVIKGVDIQSVDEYYSLHSDDTANAAHTVTLTVGLLLIFWIITICLTKISVTSAMFPLRRHCYACRKDLSSVRATPPLICWKKLQECPEDTS